MRNDLFEIFNRDCFKKTLTIGVGDDGVGVKMNTPPPNGGM